MVMPTFNNVKRASTSTGRKKIEIKKLEKVSNKQVTFSKRRNGLFKKASEICVLCNAHVAIVVFSPAGKVFCFGQPDFETVVNRYLLGQASDHSTTAVTDNRSRPFAYGELNRQYEDGLKKLAEEKLRLTETEAYFKNGSVRNWWYDPIDDMGMAELEQYTLLLEELRRNLAERLDELLVRTSLLPSPLLYEGMENHGGGLSDRHQFGGADKHMLDKDRLNLGF